MKKLLMLGLAAFALSACGAEQSGANDSDNSAAGSSESAAGAANTPDTFTYAIAGDPVSMNPITAGDRWGLTVVNMIYSPLVRIESDGSQKLELAESVTPSEDGLSIRVKLKENLVWSDGEALNADDVIFTYQQKADKKNGNADTLWIGDKPIQFEKIDDLTMDFILPEPSASALNSIATETYIMPEHIYGDVADFSVAEFDIEPVGSGPYQLEEYQRGEYFHFSANDSYYGGEPNIDNLVLRIIGNADTTKVALQSGEVDASFVLPSDIEDFNQDDINIYPFSENRVGYIGANTLSEKLQDERVREAVMFALDRKEMNQAAYLSEEYYENAYSFLPPNNPFYTDELETYERDVEKSKSLLKEAGVTDLTITLGYSADDPTQNIVATLAQQQLQEAGIKLELSSSDSSALIAEIQNPESTKYDLFINGYIMGTDPDLYSMLFTSDGAANFFHYKDEEIDQLFNEGAVELNEAQRTEIYAELQNVIADKAIMYPLVDNKKIFAANKRVGNIEEAKFVPIYSLEDMSKLTLSK